MIFLFLIAKRDIIIILILEQINLGSIYLYIYSNLILNVYNILNIVIYFSLKIFQNLYNMLLVKIGRTSRDEANDF